jgi:hypothetical protein
VAARPPAEPIRTSEPPKAPGPRDGSLSLEPRFAIAAPNTTVLASYSFDVGGTCSQQGWTVADGSAQIAIFWHVDDFAGANVNPGDSYAVIAGSKSLWCGARAVSTGPICGYLTLPGYGSSWNQVWQTKTCIPVTGNLDVSFLMETDSEPAYDATILEYTSDCVDPKPLSDWDQLDGGINDWDGVQNISHSASYSVAGNPVRVRLRFFADGGFADDDGLSDSHAGPVVIDNLTVEGLPLEDFEGESVGAPASNDWEGAVIPGYGSSALALFPGTTLVQTDPCVKNLSCMWAAIAGSPETYACGGFPQQAAVPKMNSEGQYINVNTYSPLIPLVGTGSVINYQFTVYRDMTLDGLVYYIWDVRGVVNGCEHPWRSRGFVYFGPQKDYLVNYFPVGDMLPAGSTHMRVRLGVLDQCAVWCGVFGTGACHSHAPLLDAAKVYRVDIVGPVYSTRDIDMFQDTFPEDGTDTGIARADAALSITASASPTILPGDSARVICRDPITAVAVSNPSGLATDILGGTGNQQPGNTNGNKACYLWVHVLDSGVPSATKTGAALSGGPQYPFKDTQVAFGKTWTRIQCWLRTLGASTFVVDLNDNLFEAGDVIEFFFGATNTNGQTSYASGSALNYVQSDVDLAAEVAAEFSVLPLDDPTDILYVDGMDGRSAQIYWDTAFENLGLTVQRYDVRGPTSSVSNRPATRVKNVAQQLNANYKFILWDAGDLTQSLGDGTGAPEKSNDYAMVNQFFAGLTTPGGLYVCGDDLGAGLNAAAGASAVTFKTTYLTYTLTTGNHRPTFGISPTGVGAAGTPFDGETFVMSGTCPLLNDFDVMTPTGTTAMQVGYGTPATTNGAVIRKQTGNAHVVWSGFSLIYLRDDEEDGTLDRALHVRNILCALGDCEGTPTSATPVFFDRLEQNYPNPFNPQTTIAFSLKQRGRVRVDVYNVAGQLVKTLLNESRAAGSYTDVRWDGRDARSQTVASGVYFYKLVTDGFSQTRKMVLLK